MLHNLQHKTFELFAKIPKESKTNQQKLVSKKTKKRMSNTDSPKFATFFISTGRCGTQWFADKLSTHYSDLAVVDHEPFQADYETRFYFNAYHKKEDVKFSDVINEHLESINNITQNLQYIETGWPAYGMLPFILSRFQGRVKVVHLYRNPLKVAASLTTHRVYSREKWTEAVSILPSDYGVAQGYLDGDEWNSMSEFEKCLFWSTEINHFALDLKRNFSSVPWLSVKFEDVFSENGTSELRKILEFLSLPEREEFYASREQTTDRFSLKTDETLEVRSLKKYPKAIEQMQLLGYSEDTVGTLGIKSRYKRPLTTILLDNSKKIAKSLLRKNK